MRRVKHWSPVIIWMGFIFFMSTGTFSARNTSLVVEPLVRFFMPSVSQEEIDLIHVAVRKSGHVAEYFILGMLLFNAFRGGSAGQQARQWALCSLMVASLYAAGDELHQAFVATRTASLMDVCIDISGVILGQWASVIWHRRTMQ